MFTRCILECVCFGTKACWLEWQNFMNLVSYIICTMHIDYYGIYIQEEVSFVSLIMQLETFNGYLSIWIFEYLQQVCKSVSVLVLLDSMTKEEEWEKIGWNISMYISQPIVNAHVLLCYLIWYEYETLSFLPPTLPSPSLSFICLSK